MEQEYKSVDSLIFFRPATITDLSRVDELEVGAAPHLYETGSAFSCLLIAGNVLQLFKSFPCIVPIKKNQIASLCPHTNLQPWS